MFPEPSIQPRRSKRTGLSDVQRIELLEDDMDMREAEHRVFTAEDRKFQEETRKNLDKANRVLMGILISITTAMILLAVNISIGLIGGS